MQFLAPTFAEVTSRHPPPPGGASPPSRYNPHDAVHTAAAYLCDSGARDGDLPAAVFAYNRSRAYVDHVLTQATTYRATPTPSRTTGAAAVAIEYARGQIGLPYLWGGDGPDRGEAGFDCSGLTTAAYAAAAITIPRTAQTQYNAGPRLTPDQPLAPGDLVFFGTSPRAVTHVGIAISPTEMINAPRRGALVRVDRIWRSTYLGASRPSLRTD